MKKVRVISTAAMLALLSVGTMTFMSCDKECEIGYEGSNCKTLSREKFVGTWNGTEACTTGNDTYQLTITAAGDDIKLNYSNLYNENYSGQGTMTGTNTFSFSGENGGATWSGTGSIDGSGRLTVTYQIGNGAISNSCTFTGTK